MPLIGYQTSASPSRFENAGGRTEAVTGHALPADVQDGARRAVEGVVVACVDVSQVLHIRRHCFILPAIAAEQKLDLRALLGGGEEEVVNPSIAVRQAVAQKAEIS